MRAVPEPLYELSTILLASDNISCKVLGCVGSIKVEEGLTVLAIAPKNLWTENLNSNPVEGSRPELSISSKLRYILFPSNDVMEPY